MEPLPALDALWSRAASRSVPGEIACRPGCVACCTGLFAIGAAEARQVRRAVESLAAADREAVRAAAEEVRRATASSFPGDPGSGLLDGDAGALERFASETRNVACPLLRGGRCLAYAHRPATCRIFGLALVEEGRMASPACELNFAGSPPESVLRAGLSAAEVCRIERALDEELAAEGRDPSAETTIAHAIAGTAFA